MKRIYIAAMLPNNLIIKHGISSAGCNFSFNLISGDVFDKVFSIMGTRVGGTLEPEAYKDERFELMYCLALRRNGRAGRILATVVEQWRIFRKIENNTSTWYYNVTTINILLIILLLLFKPSVQVNVIVLDFTPAKKLFSFNRLFLKVINKCHGNIRLAESPLFTNKNSVILPGVVPSTAGKEPLISKPNNKFLLSGVLFENIAQTSMVLEAFSRLPQCELHITGKIDDDSKLRDYASKYPNITWHGQVPFPEYLDIMHSCTFQLSTRDEKYPENQCNFPSKIIEALLHNRIIISTINYQQIECIKYFNVTSGVDFMVQSIQSIIDMTDSQLMQFANQGVKVANMFSTKVWNNAMNKIERQ